MWDALRGASFPPEHLALALPGAVALLAHADADLQARDPQGHTLLHAAVRHGDVAVVEWLVRRAPALVHEAAPATGRTPMHLAALRGDTLIVRVLAYGGRDSAQLLGGGDLVGWTPLHLAAMEGHVAAAEALLQLGARGHLEARDTWGRTPLALAVEHAARLGSAAMVTALVAAQADRGVVGADGACLSLVAMRHNAPASVLQALGAP